MFGLRNKKFGNKKLVILLALVLVVAAGGAAFAYTQRSSKTEDKPAASSTKSGDTEKKEEAKSSEDKVSEADQHKEEIAKRAEAEAKAAEQPASSAYIVFTEANSGGVRAYVNGVFEEGGTCTATATQGGTTVTKKAPGFQNVSYTQCAPLRWDAPLSSGTWTITVSYDSNTTHAKESKNIKVN